MVEVVYRTSDGLVYKNKDAAEAHETGLRNSLVMLDAHGKRTDSLDDLWIVWIKNELGSMAFFNLLEARGEDVRESDYIDGYRSWLNIGSEDYGLFVYDGFGEFNIVPNDAFVAMRAALNNSDV